MVQMQMIEACGFAQIHTDVGDEYDCVILTVHDLMAAVGRKLAATHGWWLPEAPSKLNHDTAHAVVITDCSKLRSGGVRLPATQSLILENFAPEECR